MTYLLYLSHLNNISFILSAKVFYLEEKLFLYVCEEYDYFCIYLIADKVLLSVY